MFLADTFPRADLPCNKQNDSDFETMNTMKYLPIFEKRMQRDLEFVHLITSPQYSQANGKAKTAVKQGKKILLKRKKMWL